MRGLGKGLGMGVIVWDLATAKERQQFKGHMAPVYSLDIAGDNLTVATGDRQGNLLLWNAESGQSIRRLKGHKGPVTSLSFADDGKHLASAGADEGVRIWDCSSGQVIRTPGPRGHVQEVAYSPDGRLIAAGGKDRRLRVWHAETGELLHEIATADNLIALAWSPDMSTIACSLGWKVVTSIHVVNLKERRVERELTLGAGCWGLTYAADGRHLVSVSTDGRLIVWDVQSGRQLSAVSASTTGHLSLSPDGKTVLTGGGSNLHLWQLPAAPNDDAINTFSEILRYEGHTNEVLALAFTPDGSHLVSAGLGVEGVLAWNTRNGRRVQQYKEHRRGVHALAISPDGKQVLSAGKDDALHLWDYATGATIRRFTGHTGFVDCVAFSSDGKRLVSGSSNWVRGVKGDVTVRMWNVETSEQLWQAEVPKIGDKGAVHAVLFDRDGKRVITAVHGPRDGLLVLDALTGELQRRFSGEHSSITCAAVSPDGRFLATGHEAVLVDGEKWDDPANAAIRLWNLKTGNVVRKLIGHRGGVRSLDFSADGERLLSCSGGQYLNDPLHPAPAVENSVRVWNVATGKPLAHQALAKHGQKAIFSPDGRHCVSSCGAYNEQPLVQLWRLPENLGNTAD